MQLAMRRFDVQSRARACGANDFNPARRLASVDILSVRRNQGKSKKANVRGRTNRQAAAGSGYLFTSLPRRAFAFLLFTFALYYDLRAAFIRTGASAYDDADNRPHA
jgi:hypothetical protein